MNDFNSNIPIYIQVIKSMKMDIISGKLKPGDKIPSVRELALSLSVNPNTIQKALSELEREGFLVTERAVGRYVSDNQELIEESKNIEIDKRVEYFVKDMKSLGLTLDDIKNHINNLKEDHYE